MRSLLSRLVGFGSLPLLASLAPLLLLGIVTRSCTVEEWAALSVGQAVGSFATAAVMFGWQVVGPPAVALAETEEARSSVYASSWWMRLFALVLVTPGAAIVAAALSPSDTAALAALMCASAALSGLSMTWYAIGLGRSGLITAFEVVPRLSSLAVGAAAVAATGRAIWYPVCAILGVGVAQALFHRRRFARFVPTFPGRAEMRSAIRLSAPGAGVILIAGARSAAPVPAATFVGDAGQVALLSSADRLYRYGLFSASALGDALQNWVLEATGRRRRHAIALGLHLGLGLAGAVALIAAGPLATRLLFGEHLAAPLPLFVGYAAAFFFVSSGTPIVRNILVPQGRTRVVVVCDTIGLACGGAAAVPMIAGFGVPGIPLALAVAEGVAASGYTLMALRARRVIGTDS